MVRALPAEDQLRASVLVVTDFAPPEVAVDEPLAAVIAPGSHSVNASSTSAASDNDKGTSKPKARKTSKAPSSPKSSKKRLDRASLPTWGAHALPRDYSPMVPYLKKVRDIFEFEAYGGCAVCKQAILADAGLYVVCPTMSCMAVGHLTCWSNRLLETERRESPVQSDAALIKAVVPVSGTCPECRALVYWGDMMKELTLRLRGQKEVKLLLDPKKKRGAKSDSVEDGDTCAVTADEEGDDDEDLDGLDNDCDSNTEDYEDYDHHEQDEDE